MAQIEQFFQAAQEAWEVAAQQYPPSQHCYCIGGLVVQLQIIGKALATRLTPVLAHLAISAQTTPALKVLLWDRAVTAHLLPPSPWQIEDYGQRSELHGYPEQRFLAAYQLDSGSLSLLDRQNHVALYAVQDATHLPYYEDGMPLRTILHWWLRDQGRQLIHAAAVGNAKRGVLIVGKSGSGKSTTALASLLAGMSYVADDYCAVGLESQPMAYSLYSSGKVAAAHLQHFPALNRFVNNRAGLSQGEKALILLHHHFPAQLSAHLALQAILLPVITGKGETNLVAASKSAALRAAAPSTIFQLANGGEQDFRFLARLIEQTPVYRLNLGTELTQIPEVIQTLL